MKYKSYLRIRTLIKEIKRILINDYQTEDYKAENIFILASLIENEINLLTPCLLTASLPQNASRK